MSRASVDATMVSGMMIAPPKFMDAYRSRERPGVEKRPANVSMREVVAHEQERLASSLRRVRRRTIAEVGVGVMTHDLAEAAAPTPGLPAAKTL
jgi:hypothetical protein